MNNCEEIKEIVTEFRKKIYNSQYNNYPVKIIDSCSDDIYKLETIMRAAIKYTTYCKELK